MTIGLISTDRYLREETTTVVSRKNHRRDFTLSCLSLTLVLASFIGLTAWSWRKWPDVLVDFGNQLYIPWQLASGKILYEDLSYLTGGPFSQHVHALLFSLFGVSLTVLILFNLCLLVLLVILLYRFFLSSADRWTATAVCLVTLFVFSFSQYVGIGNYNYICSYSYETFHGLVLSVGAIGCLSRWIKTRVRSWAFAGGVVSGTAFLTKPDIYLAVLAAIVTAVSMSRAIPAFRSKAGPRGLTLLVAGHAAPAFLTVSYYTVISGFQPALRAAGAAWLPALTTSMPHNPFYQWCLGLDRPSQNVILMLEYFAGFCLMTAFLAVCSRYFLRRNVLITCCLGALVLILIYLALFRFSWQECGRPLAPLLVVSCAFIARKWWGLRYSAANEPFVLPLLLSIFALVLLAKMGVNTRIWHYGFYLAMPAGLIAVFSLLWLIPSELRRFGVNSVAFRILVTVFLVIGGFRLLTISNFYYQAKDFPVGESGDRIIAYNPRLVSISEGILLTVRWLQANTDSDSTLAVLPDGVIINYLARRVNPTPFPMLPAPEFLAHGEPTILAAFARTSPDYIVLVHRESREFGVRYFGQEPGFGMDMMTWLRAEYTPLWQYGAEPLQTDQFGISILVRKDRQPERHGNVKPPTD